MESISQSDAARTLPAGVAAVNIRGGVGDGDEFAAGHAEAIPRAFLAVGDAGTLVLAFLLARALAPGIQKLLLPTGPLGLSLPAWLAVPYSASLDPWPSLASVAWMPLVTLPTMLLFMELLGGYRDLLDQGRTRLFLAAVLAPAIAISFLTLALFASKNSGSGRVFVFSFGFIAVLGLLTYRSVLRLYKQGRLAAGVYAKNVLFIGNPSAVRWMVDHFRNNVPRSRYRVIGWMPVGVDDVGEQVPLLSHGPVDDLGTLLIHRPVHEVIAVQSSDERDWLRGVIESCDYFRVRLRIVPEALLTGNPRDLTLVFRSDPLRLPAIVLTPPNVETDALFLKRLIDIVVSSTLLVLLAPLFLVIAIGIKLTTPHLSVFYPWRVIGLKGRPFTGYKFTTMVADADDRKQELLARNEMSGPVFKIKNDPRVTPFGRFLRKFSLNELPQLWSVFKGDMSLVGPRPAGPHELARYELWHKRKLCVQPGITCLWQVSGRNGISDFDDWVRLDLAYIDKWSLWLDFRILIRTAWAVVGGTGS